MTAIVSAAPVTGEIYALPEKFGRPGRLNRWELIAL
jgi:hypothetical protein